MADKKNTAAIDLDEQGLEQAVNSHTRLVVDCWAPWCPDCRRLAPVFDALAEENAGKITFASVNMDNNQGMKDKYQILAVPTLLIFKDGKLVSRLVEPAPNKGRLQGEIDNGLT